jgi:hypothetical protein
MITPDGKSCKHYYQDFHRGRNVQECRLAKLNPDSANWNPSDCAKCQIPDILMANADPNMELQLTIKKGFMGFGRRIEIIARDKRDGSVITNPYIGRIDADHPGMEIFRQAIEELDDD